MQQTLEAEAPLVEQQDVAVNWTKSLIRFALWAWLALMVFLVVYGKMFNGLQSSEAMDYAQVARHLAQGEGYITSVISPFGLRFNASLLRQPDASHPPLYPLALAGVFKVMQPSDRAVTIASALFYLLTMPLLFLLAKQMFSLGVANLALLFYILSLPVVSYGVSGLPTSLAGFLLTLTAYALWTSLGKEAPKEGAAAAVPSKGGVQVAPFAAAGVGVLVGLCALTQYSLGLLALPVMVLLWRSGGAQRKPATMAFLVAFVAVVTPWLIRNAVVFRNPFFTLRQYEVIMGTSTYPGRALYRSLEVDVPTPVGFLLGEPLALGKKIGLGLDNLYKQLPDVFNPFLMPFMVVALFYPFRQRGLERMRTCFFALAVLLTFGIGMVDASVAAFVPLLPVAFVYAAAGLARLCDDWIAARALRRAVTVGVVAVVAFQLVALLALQRRPDESPSAANARELRGAIAPGEVVVTDVPWLVAWYSDKPAVWLPFNPANLRDVEKVTEKQVRYLYLSSEIGRRVEVRGDLLWRNLLQSRPYNLGQYALPQFELSSAFGSEVVYTRRE